MRPSSRRPDDADVIRARLRALLDQGTRTAGWLPDEEDVLPPDDRPPWAGSVRPTRRALLQDGVGAAEDEAGPDDPEVEVEVEVEAEVEAEAGPAGLGRHRAPGPTVRMSAGRRGARSLWIAALVAAVLVAGWTWLHRPRVVPVEQAAVATATASDLTPPSPAVGEAAQTASTIVASVVGEVLRPGLVTLPTGARVADAIAAAGGLLPGADPASVNLAAVVADGQQVAVGVPAAGGGAGQPGTGVAGAGDTSAGPAGLVDLNAATAADLDGLPGIGPVLAQRIIDHRDQQGRFTTVEQLDDVPGIGPAIYDRLSKLVTV